jgi:hypothetical protein
MSYNRNLEDSKVRKFLYKRKLKVDFLTKKLVLFSFLLVRTLHIFSIELEISLQTRKNQLVSANEELVKLQRSTKVLQSENEILQRQTQQTTQRYRCFCFESVSHFITFFNVLLLIQFNFTWPEWLI